MEFPKPESGVADPAAEVVDSLVALFADIQGEKKDLRELKPSESYFDSEDAAMVEEDADRMPLERCEDALTEEWSELAPEMKGKALKKLLEMGRADIVKQIAKFSDISSFVDVKTLE